MADPEKRRKRAQEEYTQIAIRIRAQEALVRELETSERVVQWHDAQHQLKRLREKRQDILRRM